MNGRFYERNSGARLVEEVLNSAVQLTDTFQVAMNEYIRFHLVNERLKELQPQLAEQQKKVNGLRQELEKAERL